MDSESLISILQIFLIILAVLFNLVMDYFDYKFDFQVCMVGTEVLSVVTNYSFTKNSQKLY